ncbi:AAA family ATPase [Secundilactobacillus kimchicus]|uniref:AAA family ATPase n=1 Tax=Secundilactobacillus kimchicus TaxID=528209 RepID=UPI001C039E85|nr:AAA family ATPase [Secundilactobacillus kimchicus]MBT9670543.1 AAA family ATPase [Secundilactobacillus kimchicus]
MELVQLEATNFMVFGDKQTLNLEHQGLALIEGVNKDADSFESNGSGKSTLISAIIYALFGKTPDGSAGDSVINNKVGKGTEVALTFKQQGITYIVKRYRKHSKFKNKVLLFQNGQEVTESSAKLTDEKIVHIIGIDMNTYLHSVVFGLGNVANFSEATDKEKKEILEDIANIAVYKDAQSIAKEDLKQAKGEVKIKQNDLLNLAQQLGQTTSVLEVAQSDYEVEKEKLNKDLSEATEQLKTSRDVSDDLQALRASNAAQLESIQELSNQRPNNTLAVKVAQQQSEYHQLQKNEKDLLQSLTETKQEIVDVNSSAEPRCKYCGNILDANHKQAELKRLAAQYQDIQTKGSQEHSKLVKLEQSIKELSAEVDKETAAAAGVEKQIAQRSSELKESTAKANELQDQLNYYASLKQIQENSKAQLAEIENKYPARIKEYIAQVTELKEKIDAANKEATDLDTRVQDLEEVVDVYSDQGVKSHVLDLVMPFINTRANYYLGELSDNTISLNISTQTKSKNGNVADKLDVQVENVNGGDEYGLNSKGERRRIDLAISLALQDYVMTKTNTKTNFIAYDEVFDGLDSTGVSRVMNILKERIKEVPTILVVSHNAELKELFESTITVKKNKGISIIETE